MKWKRWGCDGSGRWSEHGCHANLTEPWPTQLLNVWTGVATRLFLFNSFSLTGKYKWNTLDYSLVDKELRFLTGGWKGSDSSQVKDPPLAFTPSYPFPLRLSWQVPRWQWIIERVLTVGFWWGSSGFLLLMVLLASKSIWSVAVWMWPWGIRFVFSWQPTFLM